MKENVLQEWFDVTHYLAPIHNSSSLGMYGKESSEAIFLCLSYLKV